MGLAIKRCATASFAPHEQLIACGTVAGAMDDSFSTSASLEIFQIDHAHRSDWNEAEDDESNRWRELKVRGSGV